MQEDSKVQIAHLRQKEPDQKGSEFKDEKLRNSAEAVLVTWMSFRLPILGSCCLGGGVAQLPVSPVTDGMGL